MHLKDFGGFWPLFLVGLAMATWLVLGFGGLFLDD